MATSWTKEGMLWLKDGTYTNDLRNIDKGRHRDETLERVTAGQRLISN